MNIHTGNTILGKVGYISMQQTSDHTVFDLISYHTVCLGFLKFLIKYVSAYSGYTLKKSAIDLFDDVYGIAFLTFFINAYVVDTHLNCINKLMQFKWVATTYTL